MTHDEFKIGLEFHCGGSKWLCTDVGTRTVAALRADRVTVAACADGAASAETRPVTSADFQGPPYANAEILFDELDIDVCRLHPGS